MLTFKFLEASREQLPFRLLVLRYVRLLVGLNESRTYCSSPKRLLDNDYSDWPILVVAVVSKTE